MVVYIPPQPYDFDQVYRISCEFPPIEYISNSITTQLVSPISLSFFLCYVMVRFVIMFTKVPAHRERSVYICLKAPFASYVLINRVFLRATELIDPVPVPSRLQTDVELMWWLELTKTSPLVDPGSPFNTRARFDLREAKDKDVPTVTSYD